MPALMLLLLAADAGASGPRFAVPGAKGPFAQLPLVVDDTGHPQAAWSVRSSEPAQALVRHFAKELTRAGLYVAPAEEQVQFDNAAQLTGIDARTRVAHTVLVFPQARGALVVQAQTRLDVTVPRAPVELPRGANALGSFGSEGVTTVVFEVVATEPEVRAFFKKQPDAELTLTPGEGGVVKGAVKVRTR